MKIILTKDTPGHGRKGEIKEVSDGFAKNFLIAKGFAQIASVELQAKIAKESKEAQIKKLKETEKLEALKSDLEKRTFILTVKVGDKGQIFSGVHEKDIAKSVAEKMSIAVDKNQIQLNKPIKELGEHKVVLKLASGLFVNLNIKVEAIK